MDAIYSNILSLSHTIKKVEKNIENFKNKDNQDDTSIEDIEKNLQIIKKKSDKLIKDMAKYMEKCDEKNLKINEFIRKLYLCQNEMNMDKNNKIKIIQEDEDEIQTMKDIEEPKKQIKKSGRPKNITKKQITTKYKPVKIIEHNTDLVIDNDTVSNHIYNKTNEETIKNKKKPGRPPKIVIKKQTTAKSRLIKKQEDNNIEDEDNNIEDEYNNIDENDNLSNNEEYDKVIYDSELTNVSDNDEKYSECSTD